jgi:hypothetical protein
LNYYFWFSAICAPYCVPQPQSHEISYYPQNPKVLLPAVGFRRNHAEKVMSNGMSNICNSPMVYNENMQQRIPNYNFGYSNQETLDLFPLHPTGILEGKTTDQVSSIVSVSADTSTDTHSGSSHLDINQDHGYNGNKPFFDFFNNSAGQGS